MSNKRVLVLTATRAEYGKLKPLLRAMEAEPSTDPVVVASGMHLLPEYGYTVRELEKDGFAPSLMDNDAGCGDMARILGNTITGLAKRVASIKPDLIVVHGDRVEALAGATVGGLNNVLVAHVEGGEVSGTIDEHMRHAISKMSHLHFVANEEAARRLRQLGEDPSTIHVIGSPDLDVMCSDDLPTLSEVRERYDLPDAPYGILAWHPVTTDTTDLATHTDELLVAARSCGLEWVIPYPNNDHGSDVIRRRYKAISCPRLHIFPSIRFEHMLTLLKHAEVVMGNSSMGIREAPFYGTPAIDIGSRQRGRGNPRMSFDSPRVDELCDAIRVCRMHRLAPSKKWGDGKSAARFVDVIKDPATWATSVQKVFRDLGEVA